MGSDGWHAGLTRHSAWPIRPFTGFTALDQYWVGGREAGKRLHQIPCRLRGGVGHIWWSQPGDELHKGWEGPGRVNSLWGFIWSLNQGIYHWFAKVSWCLCSQYWPLWGVEFSLRVTRCQSSRGPPWLSMREHTDKDNSLQGAWWALASANTTWGPTTTSYHSFLSCPTLANRWRYFLFISNIEGAVVVGCTERPLVYHCYCYCLHSDKCAHDFT